MLKSIMPNQPNGIPSAEIVITELKKSKPTKMGIEVKNPVNIRPLINKYLLILFTSNIAPLYDR